MKAFKGFDENLQCRNFQYEIGKSYHSDRAVLCEEGFHACENPLDVLSFYPPSISRYCIVELDNVSEECESNKVVAKDITIIKELDLRHLQMMAEYYTTRSRQTTLEGESFDRPSVVFMNKENSLAQRLNCYGGVAANTGYGSMAVSSGGGSIACATGEQSVALGTGYSATTLNTGNFSVARNETLCYNSSFVTGRRSLAECTKETGISVSTGERSGAKVANNGIAVAAGQNNCAAGDIGSFLVLAEWEYDVPKEVKAVKVDGETIKPNVYYTLHNGEVVECTKDLLKT